MVDETTRLIYPPIIIQHPAVSTSRRYTNSDEIIGNTSPTRAPASLQRPPIFSIPSTTSIGSHKSINSLNNPVNNYLSKRKPQENSIFAYLSYYFPLLSWLPKYKKDYVLGDFLAGLSLASIQIPLVMSFATSLGHLSPMAGLNGIIVASLIYPIMGCVPVLIVGPGGSISLIYGQIVEYIKEHPDLYPVSEFQVVAVITFVLGSILLMGGLLRFGFLDNVLSRALLKGFLAALGVIMIINELIPELGLSKIVESIKEPHSSTFQKCVFLFNHFFQGHTLTSKISIITLSIVLSIKYIKSTLVGTYNFNKAVFFPELLCMVIFTTYLSYFFDWESQGVEIIGTIKTGKTPFINPIQTSSWGSFQKYFSTSFLCAILGYFESTTATKALGAKYNYNVSSNRELIALGLTNIVSSFCGAIPSFGGFGRSKINIMCGGTTQMASLFMGFFVLVFILFLMPYLYYLPECVLALSTTIVGLTILEEIPQDLLFFWRVSGYDEIITFSIIFFTTIFWSAEAGVALGVGLAVIRLVKHSTKSRIQIMGRVPGTTVYRNADELIEETFVPAIDQTESLLSDELRHDYDNIENIISEMEEIEGCLIVTIPEPLTFANIGDLRNRLNRIEKYGTLLVHPSQPRIRDTSRTKALIIDVKGMSKVDTSAIQGLYEIVKSYRQKDIIVVFTRVPTDIKIREIFKSSGIVDLVKNETNAATGTIPRSLSSSSIVLTGLGEGFYSSIDEALKVIDRSQAYV